MPACSLNNSTHGTPANQDWVHVTITKATSELCRTKNKKIPTPPPATAQEEWKDDGLPSRNVTPTSLQYSEPVEINEQRKARKAAQHLGLSWTACYNDECLVHLSEKQGEGLFPRKSSKKVK